MTDESFVASVVRRGGMAQTKPIPLQKENIVEQKQRIRRAHTFR